MPSSPNNVKATCRAKKSVELHARTVLLHSHTESCGRSYRCKSWSKQNSAFARASFHLAHQQRRLIRLVRRKARGTVADTAGNQDQNGCGHRKNDAQRGQHLVCLVVAKVAVAQEENEHAWGHPVHVRLAQCHRDNKNTPRVATTTVVTMIRRPQWERCLHGRRVPNAARA
jgi:hypothetical protein